MALRNTAVNYGSLAKLLHWLVAIGIFYLIYLGLQQDDMESGDARAAIRALRPLARPSEFCLSPGWIRRVRRPLRKAASRG